MPSSSWTRTIMAALFGAALLGFAASASATAPLPERNPTRPSPQHGPQDVPLPERRPSERPEPPPHPKDVAVPDWTEQEIAAARAVCAAMLETREIALAPLEPVRRGRCGAPAPGKVSAAGAEPEVAIAPAATLRCKMAGAVGRWLKEVVQPAAMTHLGQPVTRIRNAASYVCRTRYDDLTKRISEHALANALDIAAFETGSGERITVLEHWVSRGQPGSPEAPATAGGNPNAPALPAQAVPSAPKPKPDQPEVTSQTPPEQEVDASPEPKETPQSAFLRAVHEGACRIFGTVLGPDANEAHRDHFHFDLKPRRSGYCR